jgi:hypothetical protein
MNSESVAQELIALAQTEEQVTFITAKADVTLLTEIAILKKDADNLREQLDKYEIQYKMTYKILMDFVDKVIRQVGNDKHCC